MQLGLVLAHADGEVERLHCDAATLTVRAGFFLLIAGSSERAVARMSTWPDANGERHRGVVLVAHQLGALGLLGEIGVLRRAAHDGDLLAVEVGHLLDAATVLSDATTDG